MIDGGTFPNVAEPIQFRLKIGQGIFYANINNIGDIVCNSIEGKFLGIIAVNFKGYPYYALQIKDETNLYQLLFVPKASLLRYLLQCIMGEAFSDIKIECDLVDGKNRLRIWIDNERAYPHHIEMPRIKRVRDGRTMPYYCIYDSLLSKVAELVLEINNINNIQHTGVADLMQE